MGYRERLLNRITRASNGARRMASETEILREHATAIVQSGALGRSRSYARLLEFLVECAGSGRTPKELEIAIEDGVAALI